MSRTWLAGQELPQRPSAVSPAAGPEAGVEQPATAVRLLSGREVVDNALAAPWPIRADSPLPDLARLTHALAHCDPVFLDSRVDGRAVLADVLRDAGHEPEGLRGALEIERFRLSQRLRILTMGVSAPDPAACCQVSALAALLLRELLDQEPPRPPGVILVDRVGRMTAFLELLVATLVPPSTWPSSESVRQEVCRTFLAGLGLCAAGENPHQTADRWEEVSTLARQETTMSLRAEIEHRREVERRIAQARARESASHYTGR